MATVDREVVERLRGSAERHRRLAELHEAIGEPEKADACRTLASFEDARAERLERRLTAA